MSIKENIKKINDHLEGASCKLIGVTKTKSVEDILEAYDAGLKRIGENKVQELVEKYEALPESYRGGIEWHMIGHLQTNKVKYIASFISFIHSVDSMKLLKEINKQAAKHDRIVSCLLQIHIADEETKFGLSFSEAEAFLSHDEISYLENVSIAGVMGMATFTDDEDKIRKEFRSLKDFFDKLKTSSFFGFKNLVEISMGMSGDYKIAMEEGSTMIRVGSAIFGERVESTLISPKNKNATKTPKH